MTIKAVGYVSIRPKVSLERPYQWRLFLYSGTAEAMLRQMRPVPLFPTAVEAKLAAEEYAEAFGITIESWEGEK